MNNKLVYFPGLNGLRAIAALAVLMSHTIIALDTFGLNPYIFGAFKSGHPKGLDLAPHGVSMFFALSGFLITYLLQIEKEKHDIDIKKFYFRRIIRIFPLYYLYLFIVINVSVLFALDLNVNSILFYSFYAANLPYILGTGIPLLTHYWSLGVEEQFYLFWPWVNKKVNNLLVPLMASIAILWAAKIIAFKFYPESVIGPAIHFTRFHCMMIGAMGAILYKQGNKLFMNLIDNKICQLICWSIIFATALNQFHIAWVIDTEIISILTVCLIIGQIGIKHRIINLETNLFDFLGKISYGIYVIHPLLIFFLSKILADIPIEAPYKHIVIYFSVISTTIGLSYLSYNYIEKPFLKLKDKYVIVRSAATKYAV